MKALVTGATGFIGHSLVRRLDDPVVLSRSVAKAKEALGVSTAFEWSPELAPAPPGAFDGVEVVFHLAGESIAGRWTEAKKKAIFSSRVTGTRNLVKTLVSLPKPPRALVSISAIGFYGDRGDETLDEDSASGDDFLASVCKEWEAAALQAKEAGIRVVNPRLGLVLGESGGALAQMLTPFRMGLGGIVGSGRQWWSWVHLEDVVGLLLNVASAATVDGPVNVVSPNPATNQEFTQALGGVLHRPTLVPTPGWILKLALGEFAEVLLGSQRVKSKVAGRLNYAYKYPDLEPALKESIR